ncbi:MAG: hypothetical protein HY879_09590 [Deltaproteobacteria bacterium]|nr:hypothetical protein [Deltaproteobacteria bacterium]
MSKELTLNVPIKMHPGQEKYIQNGIIMPPYNKAIYLKMYFAEGIKIFSTSIKKDLIFIKKDKTKERKISIKYIVDKDAKIDCKKDIMIGMYRKVSRKFIIRITVAIILFLFAISPVIIKHIPFLYDQKMEDILLRVGLSNLFSFEIPLYLFITFLIFYKKIIAVFSGLIFEEDDIELKVEKTETQQNEGIVIVKFDETGQDSVISVKFIFDDE